MSNTLIALLIMLAAIVGTIVACWWSERRRALAVDAWIDEAVELCRRTDIGRHVRIVESDGVA